MVKDVVAVNAVTIIVTFIGLRQAIAPCADMFDIILYALLVVLVVAMWVLDVCYTHTSFKDLQQNHEHAAQRKRVGRNV